nr:MAG TPA: hypothetical protein [Caudoviricetes sp.]DAQ50085.1 MAG TPA: hypothetical protein [Caudoviricetes sp.]
MRSGALGDGDGSAAGTPTGPACRSRAGEPVPIRAGTSTYRRRRLARRGENVEEGRQDGRRRGAPRAAAEYRGKVEACMPS